MPPTEFPLRDIPVPYIYRLQSNDIHLQLNHVIDGQQRKKKEEDRNGAKRENNNDNDDNLVVPHGLATPNGPTGPTTIRVPKIKLDGIRKPKEQSSSSSQKRQNDCADDGWQPESGSLGLEEVVGGKRSRSIDSVPGIPDCAKDDENSSGHRNSSKRQKLDHHEDLIFDGNTTSNTLITQINPNGLIDDDGIRLDEQPALEDIKEAIIDEALPLSPMASLGREDSPITKLNGEPFYTSNTYTSEPHLTVNQLPYTLSTLDPARIQTLAYAIISQLNRTQLMDLNVLIQDNLKRDLISTLPPELASQILSKLQFKDVVTCLQVSKQWNQIIENSPSIWKTLLVSESFVSRDDFAQYETELRAKYGNVLFNFDSAYKIDFLRNFQILTNWYNPSFLPLRTSLRGHMTSVVTCLQFEDNYIITGADDKMIRVYDSQRRKFLLELAGHDGGVWALKYDSPMGIVVSGSTDRTVRVWDIKRGCCLYVFKGHTSTVRCLDIVEFGGQKYIVTGSRDNTLHVWKLVYTTTDNDDNDNDNRSYPIVYDTPENNPYFVGVLKGHVASVRSMAGHGNIVISGSYDNTLMVWDIAQMKCLYILSGHTDRIYSTIYDHKRHRCISASMDSTIRVWDLKDIKQNGSYEIVNCSSGTKCTRITDSYKVLSGHTALVGLLRLSNKFLVSGAADGTLKGWDSEDYTLKFSYHHFNLSAITTFHMDDNILVSGSERQLNIYNLRSGKLVHSNILKDAEQIWSVNFKKNLLVAAIEKNNQSFIEILDFGNQPQARSAPVEG